MNSLVSSVRVFALGLTLLSASTSYGLFWYGEVNALSPSDIPYLNLTQTAAIRVIFLGVSSDYIDENSFASGITRSVSQFASPNNITWNVNLTASFYEFPMDVMNSLIDNAYHNEGTTYYNITLLDNLLSQQDNLRVPERGYLLVFMMVPDGGLNHSWFYVQERPDLFLGRTDFFDGNPSEYWAFPPYFGGVRRVLYFDLSDVIAENPMKTAVTNDAIRLFNNSLADVFVDLLGASDSRMIAADMQRYEKYEVKILWLNATGNEVDLERIEKAFEDLMPWTNWTVTLQSRSMDKELSRLIENRTVELSTTLSYSFTLANGSRFAIQADRNVIWDVWKESGEHDPISQYLFEHVKDYFNLTDLEDRSIIPVVFLQLRNDTAIAGAAGIGPGISWFPYNVVIMGYQGGTAEAMGESGPILLTHQLRHEIGHWVSLSHHSARFELGYPKVVCSMRAITNKFCAFCKDARARMSFVSYYKATTELLSNSIDTLNRFGNQESLNSVKNNLSSSLQLFYDWDYVESVESVKEVYSQTQEAINEAMYQSFVSTRIIPIAITLAVGVTISSIILVKLRTRRRMKQLSKLS